MTSLLIILTFNVNSLAIQARFVTNL